MTQISVPIAIGRRYDIQALLPAAILPLWLTLLGPWWVVYEFHADEGVNLMKAALVANGYHLYDQIWNDQPPVLTLILAGTHWFFPYNVGIARVIILAFSSLLLWAFFRIVRRSNGELAAWSAVAALGLSTLFLLFSVSVLIGLPAIALALCALDQAMIGASKQSRIRLLLAGVLFGLSLQVKMFTALVLPSLVCAVLLFPKAPTRADPWRWREVMLTLAAALATFLVIEIEFGEPLVAQLISPHWEESRSDAFDSESSGWVYFGQLLVREPILLGFGIVGAAAVALRPRELCGTQLIIIPVLWLCMSVIVFTHHKPVWPHHLPMTLVPMAWLGGNAVAKGAEWLRAIGLRASYRTAIAFVVLAALIVAGALTPLRFGTKPPPENPIAAAMGVLRVDASAEPWVVTDAAIDAYRARVLIPPELAVFTGKRVRQGYLTSDVIVRAIRERQPSQVMFRQFEIDPDVRRFLRESSYSRLVWSAEPHYIRGDLVQANPSLVSPPRFAWPN
jgi:hypothetical protein